MIEPRTDAGDGVDMDARWLTLLIIALGIPVLILYTVGMKRQDQVPFERDEE